MKTTKLRWKLSHFLAGVHFFVLGALNIQAYAIEAEARLKWFSTVSVLPSHDLQRQQQGTPANDHSADLRIMVAHETGSVRLLLDHSTILLSGDAIALNRGPDSTLDQTVREDDRRRWDLTWELDEGGRHQSLHRLDRVALQWQPGNWSVTLGRQAVSWGSGVVFQPMDLFSPFSPTVVDRDYKSGDDLVLIDRLLDNGHDLQFLHVLRRDASGDATQAVTSTAFKWHGYAGPGEFEAVVAQHYGEPVYAVSLRLPLGQALLRTDLVASQDLRGRWRYSGVVNADLSFVIAERNAYVFAEYFRNGWGVDELPFSVQTLPEELQERLARGELFNLMRDYVAVGGNFEWHPLISQSATLITNLHDSSSLIQVSASYIPSDNQSMQFGLVEPLGAAGDEFGGAPLLGDVVTTGGGSRLFFRWVYYF